MTAWIAFSARDVKIGVKTDKIIGRKPPFWTKTFFEFVELDFRNLKSAFRFFLSATNCPGLKRTFPAHTFNTPSVSASICCGVASKTIYFY